MSSGFTLLDRGGIDYALVGELSFVTATEALKATEGVFENRDSARFDLASIDRADSAGVALLIEWVRRAEAAGCTLSYVNLPERVGAIAHVSGVMELLPLACNT